MIRPDVRHHGRDSVQRVDRVVAAPEAHLHRSPLDRAALEQDQREQDADLVRAERDLGGEVRNPDADLPNP